MSAETTQPDPPERLEFETDRGSSRSAWIAGGILVVLVLWMGSGFIWPSESDTPTQDTAAPQPPSVVARMSQAEPVTLTFAAEGQALPDRDTEMRAEASGSVVHLSAQKGDRVEAGQLIARLSSARAEADLARARQELERARREFNNAETLLELGAGTVDRVSEARATLAAAEAQVTNAEQALDDLNILAPFAGRIETLTLDEGEFVSAGENVGRIVDNQPLTVAIQVPQQALDRIENGQSATVKFITGETRQGEVIFVATSAASETRTLLAEIEVENADGAIPAGVSAEIVIPTGQAKAHFVSPSIVSLSPEGVLGVKTVEDGKVRFNPVEIVKAELQGVWATGLPDTARIITIGQGFVRAGEKVRTQPAAEVDSVTGTGAPPPGVAPEAEE